MSDNEWEKINVVFKLKSPIHIGYLPSKRGSVISPTRYYVPGRNLWGAITKRITEHLFENPTANNYKEIGKQVMENFRFSYFYLCDGKTIYLPRYTEKGMKYGNITKAEFEHRFIGSIISTGIDDETRTAKDKSLHEIEFINSRFKDENGNIKPVMIAGCIWIKKGGKIEIKRDVNKTYQFRIESDGIFTDNFNIISELILGGESKYGFGHVLLERNKGIKFSVAPAPFKWNNPEKVEINSKGFIVTHLKYVVDIKFKGDIELFAGRGYYDPNELRDIEENNTKLGKVISRPVYYLSPGTVLQGDINCKLNWDGTLERCANKR